MAIPFYNSTWTSRVVIRAKDRFIQLVASALQHVVTSNNLEKLAPTNSQFSVESNDRSQKKHFNKLWFWDSLRIV